MATLERKRKSFRVRLARGEGNRAPITIGAVTKQVAETVRRHIDHLESSRANNVEPPAETRAWLEEIGDELHRRIVNVGLATARQAPAETEVPKNIGDAVTRFYATCNAKPQTVLAYRQATDQLQGYFSPLRALGVIGAEQADLYVAEVRKSGLAPATQSKRLRVIKRLFSRCARWGWIAASPFEHVKPGGQTNPNRVKYLSAADVLQVIDQSDDIGFRTIIALARFGGVRCPSEVLALTWDHIDFDKGTIKILSPKTAHAGKPYRVIPLFAELRPFLEDLQAVRTSEPYVITRYRKSKVNLRTQLDRLTVKAGLEPFPKPFQNMRASRATEIQRQYGEKAAVEWCGHEAAVALAHYWSVMDVDFQQAVKVGATPQPVGWQKGWQTTADNGGNGATHISPNGSKSPEKPIKNARSGEEGAFDEWARMDSNHRPRPYQGRALNQLSYEPAPHTVCKPWGGEKKDRRVRALVNPEGGKGGIKRSKQLPQRQLGWPAVPRQPASQLPREARQSGQGPSGTG